ncbi:MAG: 1-deoxy-D-xylulose-5-phosphate reductoisomerase [Firmicutes bacterium]|nr:1-deoxy-D-xylulose-5-phosphate reductoisomerase [Bacillota bacterium]
MKNIALLGSTGSIGRQTLEVINSLGSDFKVVALTAGRNDLDLAAQVKRIKPEFAALADPEAADRLAAAVSDLNIAVESGDEGQLKAATWPGVDIVVMAQVGFSGFQPLVAALRAGKTIALANKESLVIGGDLLERLGLLDRSKILPVDSEHSALWQSIGSAKTEEIARIYLTASGGPFYGYSAEQLKQVKPAQALKHPNWEMGSKITIDSATMMNKGLEVIEAKWLFGLELEQIEVIVHRQSIIHSMVEYIDGSIIAQLGSPDMRAPIQYALTYPERKHGLVERYNPFDSQLTFEYPDRLNFPCLDLAFRAAKIGGTMPAVLNGANEKAVEYFLSGDIKFTDIPEVINSVMTMHSTIRNYSIEDAVAADGWARQIAEEVIAGLTGRMN